MRRRWERKREGRLRVKDQGKDQEGQKREKAKEELRGSRTNFFIFIYYIYIYFVYD